jgi:hypothetical protein
MLRAKSAIQELMAHSSPKTTEICLHRGPQALTDDGFQAVSAPFTLQELLGAPSLPTYYITYLLSLRASRRVPYHSRSFHLSVVPIHKEKSS